jgi:hypothetical protein
VKHIVVEVGSAWTMLVASFIEMADEPALPTVKSSDTRAGTVIIIMTRGSAAGMISK